LSDRTAWTGFSHSSRDDSAPGGKRFARLPRRNLYSRPRGPARVRPVEIDPTGPVAKGAFEMHPWKFWLGGAACLALMATVAPAKAMMIRPPSLSQRVASSQFIVVGKVTGFGPRLIKAEMFKGDKREMQVAKLKVEQTVLGKAGKNIEVAYFAPSGPVGRPGGPIRPGLRGRTVQLKVDQEAMLFLSKHPGKDLYVVNAFFDVVAKTGNPNFAKELDSVKKYVKLLAKPMDGLKAKDADTRLLTAGLLITRYRTPPVGGTGVPATREVPAEESKLILTALAEADWKKNNPQDWGMNPPALFARLGVTPADGWTPPKDARNFLQEQQKWVKANAGKYRIKRYVADAKKPEPPAEK
jgi:hypothetical protein